MRRDTRVAEAIAVESPRLLPGDRVTRWRLRVTADAAGLARRRCHVALAQSSPRVVSCTASARSSRRPGHSDDSQCNARRRMPGTHLQRYGSLRGMHSAGTRSGRRVGWCRGRRLGFWYPAAQTPAGAGDQRWSVRCWLTSPAARAPLRSAPVTVAASPVVSVASPAKKRVPARGVASTLRASPPPVPT